MGYSPGISIIIPVLNEIASLPDAIASLRYPWVREIIVVDGGSSDGTREWLERCPAVRVVDSPPRRGTQMNAGARAAGGDTLLFLHSDCGLYEHAGTLIAAALADPGVAGGAFFVRFAEDGHPLLWLTAHGINLRTRITRSATGDQAIFLRRPVFEAVGGFPDWPLFEDVELIRRIRGVGRFAAIPEPITVSGRRHLANGVLSMVCLVYALRLGFLLGVSPFTLKRWFGDVRPVATGGHTQTSTRTVVAEHGRGQG